jgi:hypothetical protein
MYPDLATFGYVLTRAHSIHESIYMKREPHSIYVQ